MASRVNKYLYTLALLWNYFFGKKRLLRPYKYGIQQKSVLKALKCSKLKIFSAGYIKNLLATKKSRWLHRKPVATQKTRIAYRRPDS